MIWKDLEAHTPLLPPEFRTIEARSPRGAKGREPRFSSVARKLIGEQAISVSPALASTPGRGGQLQCLLGHRCLTWHRVNQKPEAGGRTT